MDEPDHNHWRNKPTVHGRRHWYTKPTNEFQSVDGDKIFETNRWNGGRRELAYCAAGAMEKTQRTLVAKQDDEHSIELEPKISLEAERKMTQVPYRKYI